MSTLTLYEAASLTKCHPDTLRRMAKAREVPSTKVGRSWVFSGELLQKWIDDRCRSTVVQDPRTGGSELAATLARAREQRIASKRRNSSASLPSASGDSRSLGTVVQLPGQRRLQSG
jgi:excisionase family DNA binding protein